MAHNPHRRSFLTGLGLATTAGLATIAAPTLGRETPQATPEDLEAENRFLQDRVDLRFAILAGFPPFVNYSPDSEVGSSGFLPDLAKALALDFWLIATNVVVNTDDTVTGDFDELFSRYGGVDVLLHVNREHIPKGYEQLSSISYITDSVGYISMPDRSEFGLFPQTFHNKKVLAFPDPLITEYVRNHPTEHQIPISYQVSPRDLYAAKPIEYLEAGKFDTFISSYRQLQWQIARTQHKFHINSLFFLNRLSGFEFCAVVNPKTPWLVNKINHTLRALSEDGRFARLMKKHGINKMTRELSATESILEDKK